MMMQKLKWILVMIQGNSAFICHPSLPSSSATHSKPLPSNSIWYNPPEPGTETEVESEEELETSQPKEILHYVSSS